MSVVKDMEQRDHEVSGLRSEIEKLKRRELGWATELQDAATVTSQLTERMEILESVLATKEEALSQAQVCCLPNVTSQYRSQYRSQHHIEMYASYHVFCERANRQLMWFCGCVRY